MDSCLPLILNTYLKLVANGMLVKLLTILRIFLLIRLILIMLIFLLLEKRILIIQMTNKLH